MQLPRQYRNISVKRELADVVETFIGHVPQLGYRSISQFFEDSARKRLEDLKGLGPENPRMEIIGGDTQRAVILDRELKSVVEVNFGVEGATCSFHKSRDCEHTRFLTTSFSLCIERWEAKAEVSGQGKRKSPRQG